MERERCRITQSGRTHERSKAIEAGRERKKKVTYETKRQERITHIKTGRLEDEGLDRERF